MGCAAVPGCLFSTRVRKLPELVVCGRLVPAVQPAGYRETGEGPSGDVSCKMRILFVWTAYFNWANLRIYIFRSYCADLDSIRGRGDDQAQKKKERRCSYVCDVRIRKLACQRQTTRHRQKSNHLFALVSTEYRPTCLRTGFSPHRAHKLATLNQPQHPQALDDANDKSRVVVQTHLHEMLIGSRGGEDSLSIPE